MFMEYVMIFKYFFLCLFMSLMLFMMSFFLVFQSPNPEKISMYECGFSPFSDSSNKFEVSFYIVAILFMIFDLEVIFLFPWVMILNKLSLLGYLSMLVFLLILLIGFFYEWFKGALDWH